MDEQVQPTNESILFAFSCCGKKAHLTFGDLAGLIEGETRQCPDCSSVAVLRQGDRQAMHEHLMSSATKGKWITGFCAVWFGVGLLLHLFADMMIAMSFFLSGALIFFIFIKPFSIEGPIDVLLEDLPEPPAQEEGHSSGATPAAMSRN